MAASHYWRLAVPAPKKPDSGQRSPPTRRPSPPRLDDLEKSIRARASNREVVATLYECRLHDSAQTLGRHRPPLQLGRASYSTSSPAWVQPIDAVSAKFRAVFS